MFERNWFALTCVAVLAGVASSAGMIGCSSSDTDNVAAPGTNADAGAGSDSGKRPVDTSGGDSDPESCTRTEPVDLSSVAFKPPRVIPGSCSAEDREFFLQTALENKTLSDVEDVMKGRNPECAACIFGTDGDTWAPIVEKDNGEYIENGAGCIAVVSESDVCGKAYVALTTCLTTACSTCSAEEAEACRQEASNGAGVCAAALSDLAQNCGSDPSGVLRKCNIGRFAVEGSILYQCGGEKTDGGT